MLLIIVMHMLFTHDLMNHRSHFLFEVLLSVLKWEELLSVFCIHS